MDVVEQQTDSACNVTLNGALDIYCAAEMRGRLATLLQQHPVLELNLAEIEEMDASGVQLLLAAKQMASNLGHTLKLTAHSPQVLATLELCKLLPYFGDPVVEFGPSKTAKDTA